MLRRHRKDFDRNPACRVLHQEKKILTPDKNMSVSTTNSMNILMGKKEQARGRRGKGGRQGSKMEPEERDTDSGTINVWPYFSQESGCAFSPVECHSNKPTVQP